MWLHRKHSLRKARSDVVGSSANSLARHNLVNLSTLLIDPRGILVLERCEPRLNRLEDLLLRVQELERSLVFESFEEDSVSRLRTGGRVDEFYSSVFTIGRSGLW